MDRLWAPWRINYLNKSRRKKQRCIFCSARRAASDRKHLVILRSTYSLVILNIFPYNNGHLMAAPKRHIADISRLSEVELLDLIAVVNKAKSLLDKVIKPQGYNIGINIGRVSGAGFPGHIHIHIVPRWQGDTNFMPTVADTKVISQSLEELYDKINNAKE